MLTSVPASEAVDKADLPGLPYPETLTPLGSKMFDIQRSPPDQARTTPTLCEDAAERRTKRFDSLYQNNQNHH